MNISLLYLENKTSSILLNILSINHLNQTDQKNIIGQSRVDAKLKAACASPSLAAPSPK